jgi:hypothetical protein
MSNKYANRLPLRFVAEQDRAMVGEARKRCAAKRVLAMCGFDIPNNWSTPSLVKYVKMVRDAP